jgi:predicted RNA-binding protein YlqC (UPF0109 family)
VNDKISWLSHIVPTNREKGNFRFDQPPSLRETSIFLLGDLPVVPATSSAPSSSPSSAVSRENVFEFVRHELLDIIRPFVDHPDKVTIERLSAEKSSIYLIRAHRDDVGKIIGSGGEMSTALLVVARATACRHIPGAKITIDVSNAPSHRRPPRE